MNHVVPFGGVSTTNGTPAHKLLRMKKFKKDKRVVVFIVIEPM
jgi:hypothetical protein